jgi:uncharacterized integral membrane protein
MSAPAQTPKEPKQKGDRRSRREQARTGGLILVAILATLFAVLNLNTVEVDWIVGSGHAPLIIVVVISLLIGIVLTHFAERRAGRRR